jgi:hypothetical protein
MSTIENKPPEVENQNHRYVGSKIPWFIHLLWVSFWIFWIIYVLTYLFPALRTEIVTPP